MPLCLIELVVRESSSVFYIHGIDGYESSRGQKNTNINCQKVCCFSVFRYFCQMLLWNTEV